MTVATLIARAEKAIPIAEQHTAVSLKRQIEILRRDPTNRDALFRIKSQTDAAFYLKHIKIYGRD